MYDIGAYHIASARVQVARECLLTHDNRRVSRVGQNGDGLRIRDCVDTTELDVDPGVW
jgi:hypothetical protein